MIFIKKNIDMEFFWTGKRWFDVDSYFAVLQLALWIETAGYGGEVWEWRIN